jgi:putative transcriptional regulator
MKSLQGHLLIASRQLLDPNFFQTVVLIVQHGESGALGLILNRPLDVRIETAWAQVSESSCNVEGPLHQGGPCEGPLMAVHADESVSQIEIRPGVHFSTERDAIEKLVLRGDEDVKFFVGYAGWGPDQLEGEIEEGSWHALPASDADIFQSPGRSWDDMIRRALRGSSLPLVDPKLIPPDPTVN